MKLKLVVRSLKEHYAADLAAAGVAVPTRKNRQIERGLQAECAHNLGLLQQRRQLHCVWFAVPNGFWIPTSTAQERELARRLVSQMKANGVLQPGTADFSFMWETGCGAIELKRGTERTLFERIPKGQLSENQKRFRAWCQEHGVDYRVCDSWLAMLDVLKEWGRVE